MDTVGGADFGSLHGEFLGVVAAVHADGYAPALAFLAFSTDDVGKALGSPADDVDVHVVQTDEHGATQTGGAKLQGAVEPGLDLFGVILDGLQLRFFLRGQGGTV